MTDRKPLPAPQESTASLFETEEWNALDDEARLRLRTGQSQSAPGAERLDATRTRLLDLAQEALDGVRAPAAPLPEREVRRDSERGLWLSAPIQAFSDWVLDPSTNRGRGFSPGSATVYAAMWGKFVRFMMQRGVEPALATANDLERFVQDLADERTRVSNSSAPRTGLARQGTGRHVRRYLSLIARVQRHLVLLGLREDVCAQDLFDALDPAPQRLPPSALPRAADTLMRSMIARLPMQSWRDLRDRSLVELVVGSGLTSLQLRSLRVSDLALDEESARVHARAARRGHARPAPIPLSREAAQSLRQWLGARDAQGIGGELVFPSSALGTPMSAANLYRCVAKVMVALDSERHIDHLGPRTLRHTFATRQLRAGRPLDVLRQWLGHRRLDSTRVYEQLVPDPHGFEPV